jgi:transposase
VQKTLEDANVKLTEAISDILGATGRAILRAVIKGETDPERLADLAQGRLKVSGRQLVDVLHGRITSHHRFMLQLHLQQIEALEHAVSDVEAQVREALTPLDRPSAC